MHWSLETSVEPAAEPITLAEARLHLKIDDDITVEDSLVSALITAAREWIENYCRRSLVSRTLVLRLDCFPSEIRLPRAPVSSVTSIEYVGTDGQETVFGASSYQVDTKSEPARIRLVSGATWPQIKVGQINGVIVTYVAGYAPGSTSPTDHAENIPDAIKAATKLLLSHLFENREMAGEMPAAVKHLLAPYEIRDFTLE